MPSITTQNVASASAALVPQPPSASQTAQSHAANSPQDLARATQIAGAEQTHRNRRRDNNRTTQVPKRAEGAFANQTQYGRSKKKAASNTNEDTGNNKPGEPGMDVVA